MRLNVRSFLSRIKKRIGKLLVDNPDNVVSPTKPVKHLRSSYVYDELNILLQGQKLNFVDVGGAVNLQPHHEKLIGNANYYVFEPDERSYNDLINTVDRYAYPQDFTYINKALSGANGKRTLYLSNIPTGTSILKLKEDQQFFSNTNSYFFPMREIEINTITLETALNEYRVKHFDAIKLDVQGAELEIIKGIDDVRLNEVNTIELEIGLHDIYQNQTKFCDVLAFMTEKGFGLFDVRTNRGHLPDNFDNFSYQQKYFNTHDQSPSVAARIWEFDALFFREPHWISRNKISKERLLRIAAMYCVYNFFAEAMQVINTAHHEGKLTEVEYSSVKNAIINWNKKEQNHTADYNLMLEKRNYWTWGQYMQTGYPSN